MKLTTKKTNWLRGVIGLVIALLAVGFATGCSKKLMPPEIEASSGSSGMEGGGMGSSFSSGIGESSVGGEGAASSGAGEGAGAGGGQGSGFNIQEQAEAGPGGGFFVEENIGESGGTSGSESAMGHAGSGPEFGAGEGQAFGGGEGGLPGNGSDGFFASSGSGANGGTGASEGGTGTSGGSGSGVFGSGSHSGPGSIGEGGSGFEHADTHHPYHAGPNGGGTSEGGAPAAGSGSSEAYALGGMSQQEARLADFRETSDLSDIHFAFDKYDLTEETKEILRANADWLKQNPDARIEIQGHCDERGTNNYNLGLGERRAISTMKYLAALGVEANRIFTISYGEEKPFCFDSNDACWEQNRRAHFMVAR